MQKNAQYNKYETVLASGVLFIGCANSTHAMNHVDSTFTDRFWSNCLSGMIIVSAMASES